MNDHPRYRFSLPVEIVFGRGSLRELGAEAAAVGCRALVVAGRHAMRETGELDRALALLSGAGVQSEHYAQVEPEPSVETVDYGVHIARDMEADLIVGLGGGSVLDAAKAIAFLINKPAGARDYLEGRALEGPGVPMIAIPTLAGAGSECTSTVVLSDHTSRKKNSFRGSFLFPRVSIIDPELAISAPPRPTAVSGIDALVQAIETLVSIHATPLTECLALEASGRIFPALLHAYRNPTDLEARTDLAWGATLAAAAFSSARLGAVHGLAHPLGIRYHIPHGLVCGALLPYVMHFNREVVMAKYARLAHALGLSTRGISPENCVEEAIGALRELLRALDLPLDLSGYDIPEEDFPAIAEEALPSGSLKANPRPAGRQELCALLAAATGRGPLSVLS